MNNTHTASLLFLYLLMVFCPMYASQSMEHVDYGLHFYAYDVPKEERTSFAIKDIEIKDYFNVSFDYVLDKTDFGYITRILLSDTQSVDILASVNIDNTQMIRMSLVSNMKTLTEWQVDKDTLLQQMTPFSLTLYIDKDSLVMQNGDAVQQFYCKFPHNSKRVNLYFGANNTEYFSTTDVASVAIRDLTISTKPNKSDYKWSFAKHANSVVYDEIEKRPLTIKNPEWLINKHMKWQHLYSKEYATNTFVVSDGNDGFCAINNYHVHYTSFDRFEVKEFPLQHPITLDLSSNQFVIDTINQSLLYFNMSRDSNVYVHSQFNFESNDWEPLIHVPFQPAYRHSNLIVSPIDGNIKQLFGYGFFRYHSDIFSYDGKEIKQQNLDQQIAPRYLSAVGVTDSIAYIFGGCGNEEGKQELGIHCFYDLYKYDLVTDSVEAVWHCDSLLHDELPAKNIVFPDETNPNRAFALFFSPLFYNSYLVLKEINLEQPCVEIYSDTIPYLFQDTDSDAQLIYSKDQKMLYAITTTANKDGKDLKGTVVNVYGISIPVLHKSDVEQIPPTKHNLLYIILYTLLVCCGVATILYVRKRKLYKLEIAQQKTEEEAAACNNATLPVTEIIQLQQLPNELESRPPGIYLLGGFQVIDKEGNDITGSFSTIMKQLLMLIIVFTHKDAKGISSVRLKEFLWFDKSEDSARNNRGVHMRKIRLLLNTVGDFSIISSNSYWRIESAETDYCDYCYALRFLNSIEATEAPLTTTQLLQLIQVAQMQVLLPNQNIDFFDAFKAEYSDRMIDILHKQLAHCTDNDIRKQLTDAILIFDSIDEQALRAKCQALIGLGQLGMAKGAYDNFSREYLKLMGCEIAPSFEAFIQKTPND